MNISPVSLSNYNKTSFKNKNNIDISKPVCILPSSARTIDLYNLNINNNAIEIGSKCKEPFRLTEDDNCYLYKNGKAVPANVALKITCPNFIQTDIYINGKKTITTQAKRQIEY